MPCSETSRLSAPAVQHQTPTQFGGYRVLRQGVSFSETSFTRVLRQGLHVLSDKLTRVLRQDDTCSETSEPVFSPVIPRGSVCGNDRTYKNYKELLRTF